MYRYPLSFAGFAIAFGIIGFGGLAGPLSPLSQFVFLTFVGLTLLSLLLMPSGPPIPVRSERRPSPE